MDQYNLKLEHGIFFVVSKLKAKFLQAAKFNDLLFTELICCTSNLQVLGWNKEFSEIKI